jgi:hypothetical protein
VDRTILPATAGEDVSVAAGVVEVRVREHRPEHRPMPHPTPSLRAERLNPIRLPPRLLRVSKFIKGSQQ